MTEMKDKSKILTNELDILHSEVKTGWLLIGSGLPELQAGTV